MRRMARRSFLPWRRRRAVPPAGAATPTVVTDETRVIDGTRAYPPALPPEGPPPPGYVADVYEEPPPSRDIWPWLLALLALVIGGLSFLYFLSRDDDDDGAANTVTTVVTTTAGGGARVAVPNLVGRRETEAVETLTAAGLKARRQQRASNRRRGIVIDQRPNAGRRLERLGVVTLVISRGAARGTVPDLTGDGVDDALRELRAAGLKPRVQRVFSTEVVNLVVGQEPAGGTAVKKGTAVLLRVSKGRRPVAVPDLVGQTESQAVSLREGAGLEARVFTVPAPDPRGTVVAQDPQAGEKVKAGSRVRVNVAEGAPATTTNAGTTAGGAPGGTGGTTTTAPPQPAMVAVPDVVCLTQAAASGRLTRVGLRPSVTLVVSNEPRGTVVAQGKQPGTRVRRGSAVGINVSRGPTQTARVAVPDVTQQDQAAARTTLRNAGFTVQVVPQPTENADEEGIVLEQQPAAGTQAPRGSRVTIYVGSFEGP